MLNDPGGSLGFADHLRHFPVGEPLHEPQDDHVLFVIPQLLNGSGQAGQALLIRHSIFRVQLRIWHVFHRWIVDMDTTGLDTVVVDDYVSCYPVEPTGKSVPLRLLFWYGGPCPNKHLFG